MSIDCAVERIDNGENLLENLSLLKDINSWQTSQEVYAYWKKGAPDKWVVPANMAIYHLDGGKAVIDYLGREGNLFIEEKFRKAIFKLISPYYAVYLSGEYEQYVLRAINAGKSIRINYSGLNLVKEKVNGDLVKDFDKENIYRFVEANENNSNEEKKLFKAVYGVENPGNECRIELLKKNYVKKKLEDNENKLIVHACLFSNAHLFSAVIGCGAARGLLSYGAIQGKRNPTAITKKHAEYLSKLNEAYEIVVNGVDDLSAEHAVELYKKLRHKPVDSNEGRLKLGDLIPLDELIKTENKKD